MSSDSDRALRSTYRDRVNALATDLFCAFDREGTVHYVNPATIVLGHAAADLERSNVFALIHPDDLADAHEAIAGAAVAGDPVRFETRCRAKDGSYRWLTWHVSRHEDETFAAMMRDATERKWVERELEASLSLVEATLESTADGILVTDAAGNVATFNRRFLSLWGISDEVVFAGAAKIDAFCDKLLAAPDGHFSLMRELSDMGRADRYEVLTLTDGRVFERYSLPRWIRGELEGRVWSFRDVTERMRAERELREHLSMGIEHAVEGIARLDERGRYVAVNAVYAKMLGYTESELLGSEWGARGHPEDYVATRAAREGLLPGEKHEVEARAVRKDGTIAVLRALVVRAEDLGGKSGHHVFMKDITEQREMQERLRLADRMASMGTLAAGVAHEINNPLSFVMANAGLLSDALPALGAAIGDKKLAELMDLVGDLREGAERMRKIVRDLKLFSRPEDTRSGVVDVRPVLESSINMAWNEIRHRARLGKDYGAVTMVEGNDAQLGQVFLNLLINAAQAIPEGNAAQNEIRVVTRISAQSDMRVEIEIHDTGAGVPAALLPRIFDPFFTTKPVGMGTGLGLSVCHGIVTKLGGAIQVESKPGVGTMFRVVLRRAQDRPKAEQEQPPPSVRSPSRGRVLVVDDEVMIGNSLRRILSKDHDVVVCTSGRAALDALAAEASFDIVLCDIMMPDVSGMDVYDELNRKAPDVAKKMVFMTGGSFTPRARAFLDQVPNPRLDKPLDVKTLRTWIKNRLEGA
jgi:PAS domain S-box-containing protein